MIAAIVLVACAGDPGREVPAAGPDAPPAGETGGSAELPVDASPVALQGQLLDVPAQADPWIAEVLAGTPWGDPGVRGSVWVTAPPEPGVPPAPVDGLAPTISTFNERSWLLRPAGTPGRYDLAPVSDMPWVPFDAMEVRSGAVGAWDGLANALVPADAQIWQERALPLGGALVLEWGRQGYQSAVAVVVDASGAVTWTDDPADLDALVAANTRGADRTTIPAAAFPAPGAYAVGIAPCVRTYADDLVALDPAASAVRVGRMVFWRVEVE